MLRDDTILDVGNLLLASLLIEKVSVHRCIRPELPVLQRQVLLAVHIQVYVHGLQIVVGIRGKDLFGCLVFHDIQRDQLPGVRLVRHIDWEHDRIFMEELRDKQAHVEIVVELGDDHVVVEITQMTQIHIPVMDFTELQIVSQPVHMQLSIDPLVDVADAIDGYDGPGMV